MPNRYTTIAISRETKQLLIGIKVHPRETYDELIRRLISDKKKET